MLRSTAAESTAEPASGRPNIVWIVADDLGYADLGCYGSREPRVSPALDALAAAGLRFTQAYSNSPVCSPTRFALMTGRYQYRLRGAGEEPINSTTAVGSATIGLPPGHPTLPSLLRGAGYRTALVGKWHLGYPPHFGPLLSGYDEFFGPLAGGVDYFRHTDFVGRHDLWEGRDGELQPCVRTGYLTDLISQRAAAFVAAAAAAAPAAPFFISVHYTAPHWPWEARGDEVVAERLAHTPRVLTHLDGGNVETYRRMIQHMDEGVGVLLAALEAGGLAQDTLVVFTSDNGGERFSDNWPLVGGKMDLTEGGIRVPCVARWPRVVAGRGVTPQHCLTMDWTATMLAVAGVAADPACPLDGVSLLPVLCDAGATFPRPMAWRMKHRGQRALREGDWKYLRVDGIDYLFCVADDERERANRAAAEPGRLHAMCAAWEAWNATMPDVPSDAGVHPVITAQAMPQR